MTLRRPSLAALCSAGLLATALAAVPLVAQAAPEDVTEPMRSVETVILTGADLPTWSSAPAVGAAYPWPYGALVGERGAHDNGELVVPPVETGVDPDAIAAYRWDGTDFVEVPVQVDERFPYFLANPDSDFGIYSGTDQELTYEWDVESWARTAGECEAEYPEGVTATQDPVATLDADDEIVFQAADAGLQAPSDAVGPFGTGDTRQELAVVDPVTGATSYLYLFLQDGGSTFTPGHYVSYERAPNADEWIDRYAFAEADPEKLGTSNTGYGPNLSGTVCRTHPSHADRFDGVADGVARPSADRFTRDGVVVSSDNYRFTATGRWMVRGMQVAKPGQPGVYGADLIDRWKGRAFQSSPDSEISVVGFEDEQVNWEANSALLGERVGPVRAIREVWGADSGTNVTKTEKFFVGGIASQYRLRVHPIPSDGLYVAWDYNAAVADSYFNAIHEEGVPIDGVNDDVGNIDEIAGTPAFFDVTDPTLSVPSAIETWEQVSGRDDNGSLVYIVEIENPTTLENAAVVPYYRDDACFDDGTGDDPVARPWPGETSTDARVTGGYTDLNGDDTVRCEDHETQGAFGSHGVHFFFTGDTDNAFVSPAPTTELDVEWWQFAAPTAAPTSVGERYAQLVRAPLEVLAQPQTSTAATQPPMAETTVTYVGDTTGVATDEATLAATVTDAETGDAVADVEVTFTFQGVETTAITDADGRAARAVDVAGPIGDEPITVTTTPDEDRHSAATSATMTVLAETTRLSLMVESRERFAALLTEDDGPAVAGRTVTLTVDGTVVGEAVTDESGRATILVDAKLRKGDEVVATFGGDDTYGGAEDRVVYTKPKKDKSST